MNKESFKILENVAASSFESCHAGLHTMLRTNEQFEKYVERNYRVKKFKETVEFFMTRNELYFHLIGFMDAIIWLSRAKYLSNSGNETDMAVDEPQDDEEIEAVERAIKEKNAIKNLIICYETGEEW